jgi:hypothetical protein
MPRFHVRLSRLATDVLTAEAFVDADDEEQAEGLALEQAEGLTWEFHVEDSLGEPVVDSVTEIDHE